MDIGFHTLGQNQGLFNPGVYFDRCKGFWESWVVTDAMHLCAPYITPLVNLAEDDLMPIIPALGFDLLTWF